MLYRLLTKCIVPFYKYNNFNVLLDFFFYEAVITLYNSYRDRYNSLHFIITCLTRMYS